MGLLTQLLPGLRDLRTPAAAGVLWVLAAVLASRLLPAELLTELEELVRAVQEAFAPLPAVVVGPLAGLGVYLLGVVMTLIGSAIIRLLNAAFTPEVYAALFFVAFVRFAWQIPAFILVVSVVFLAFSAFLIWRHEGKRQSYLDVLDALWRELVVERAPGLALRAWTALIASLRPDREQIAYFVEQDAQRQIDASPKLLESLIERLPARQLPRALRTVDVSFQDVKAEHPEATEGISNWDELTDHLTQQRYGREQSIAGDLRNMLLAATLDDERRRQRFVRRFTYPSALHEETIGRLEQTDIRLKVEQPALYDQYDRLRAEGEFREGVALPVTAVILAFVVLVSREIEWLGERIWVAPLIALVVLLLFILAARSKTAAASRMLYGAVRQAIIEHRETRQLTSDDFRVGP